MDPKYNPIVTWDFSVADYTIDFRARFEPPSGEPVEVAIAVYYKLMTTLFGLSSANLQTFSEKKHAREGRVLK